jgi:hypothetical protein
MKMVTELGVTGKGQDTDVCSDDSSDKFIDLGQRVNIIENRTP